MKILKGITLFTLPFLMLACGNDDLDPDVIHYPDTYEFTSITDPSAPSSVEYLEATTRMTLINELEYLIESDELSTLGQGPDGKVAVIERLNRIYEQGTKSNQPTSLVNINAYTDESGATPIHNLNIPEELSILQNDFSDLKAGINLKDTMPGILRDLKLRNPAYPQLGVFIGWSAGDTFDGDDIANQLIQQCFNGIAILLSDSDNTTNHINMLGATDYRALAISFLRSTITYYQLITVQLKMEHLLTANAEATQSEAFTELQHQWDLAFGYFGGRANNLKHKSLSPYNDDNQDDRIDLSSEYNFYLAKEARNRDNTPIPESNFSYNITKNFLIGRQIIDNSLMAGDNTWQEALPYYNNKISIDIEKLMAANLIHYLNQIKYTAKFFLLGDAFKRNYFTAWSNSKGAVLALQFNPNSALTQEQLIKIDSLISSSRRLEANQIAGYLREINEAIVILGDTYKFGTDALNAW